MSTPRLPLLRLVALQNILYSMLNRKLENELFPFTNRNMLKVNPSKIVFIEQYSLVLPFPKQFPLEGCLFKHENPSPK